MGILTNFGNGLALVGRTLQLKLGAGLAFVNGALTAPTGDPASLPAAAPLDGSELLAVNQSGSPVQTNLGDVLAHAINVPGSSAQGDLLYRNASGWTRLPHGTSGQVLQTNGAAADPTWVTPAATSQHALDVTTWTAVAGGGTATAATGTLTLPSGTATTSSSDTPRLQGAHGAPLFEEGAFLAVQILAFTGAGATANVQACIAFGTSSGAACGGGSFTGTVATVRVYPDGSGDVINEGGSQVLNLPTPGTFVLTGTGWAAFQIDGATVRLYTGVGSAFASVAWTLRALFTISALPLTDATYALVRTFLAAQSSGGLGAVTFQVATTAYAEYLT